MRGMALCGALALLAGCGSAAGLDPLPPAALDGPPASAAAVLPELQAELQRLLSGAPAPAWHAPQTAAARPALYARRVYPDGDSTQQPVVQLSWPEALPGDFNLDGQVDAGDLTTLAEHYAQNRVSFVRSVLYPGVGGVVTLPSLPDLRASDWFERVDADGNGLLGLSDVRAVAANYGTRLDGYCVYARAIGAPQWEMLDNPDAPGNPFSYTRVQAANDSWHGRPPTDPPAYAFSHRPAAPGDFEYRVIPAVREPAGQGIASYPVAIHAGPGQSLRIEPRIAGVRPLLVGEELTLRLHPLGFGGEQQLQLDADADGSYETAWTTQGPAAREHRVVFATPGERLLRLRAAGKGYAGFALAVLEVRAANRPPVLDLRLDMADYAAPARLKIESSGCYDPEGDSFEIAYTLRRPGAAGFAPLVDDNLTEPGAYTLRAVATDRLGARSTGWEQDFTMVEGTTHPGWLVAVVSAAYTDGTAVLAEVGGRPALAVASAAATPGSGAGLVRYLAAQDAAGAQWPDLASAPLLDPPGQFSLRGEPQLADINGRPAILAQFAAADSSYTPESQLGYFVAADAQGSQWLTPRELAPQRAAWNATALSGGNLALLDGRPSVVARDTAGGVHCFQAYDEYGLDWDPAGQAALPGIVAEQACLARLAGGPALVYTTAWPGPTLNLLQPGAQAGEWHAAGGVGNWLRLSWFTPDSAGGPPLLADNYGDQLYTRRALDANGRAWGPPLPVGLPRGAAPGAVVALVDGRPWVAYVDPVKGELCAVPAEDAYGQDWAAVETLDNRSAQTVHSLSFAEVGGQPALAYVVMTSRTLLGEYSFDLRFARRKPR